jgi:hypothetical protein
MKKILCLINIHSWRNPNPFARICKHCNRLDEIHEDCNSSNTWNLTITSNFYWKTTRKSKFLKELGLWIKKH